MKTLARDALLQLAIAASANCNSAQERLSRQITLTVHARHWRAVRDGGPMPGDFSQQCLILARWLGRKLPGAADERQWRRARRNAEASELADKIRAKLSAE